MNKEEEGISLLELLKVMLGRKLVLLITTVLTAIIGTILILFVYNKQTQNYSATFSYSDSILMSGNYVDGSSFNYKSLITENNLKEIKNSSSAFKSINIDKLIDNDGISISVNNTDTTNELLNEKTYTIFLRGKFFKSTSQAKKFVNAVAETATNTNAQIVSNLTSDSNLTSYANSNKFEIKVQYLIEQLDMLDEKYETMIENYGDLVLSSGKTVSAIQNELDTYFKNHKLSSLDTEIRSNIYVYNYAENEAEYELLLEDYEYKYETNEKTISAFEAKINAIVSASSGVQLADLSEYTKVVQECTIENIEYAEEISFIKNVLGKYSTTDPEYKEKATEEENVAFLAKINTYYDKLEEFTDVYSATLSEVILKSNDTYFANASIIMINGGMSTFVAIVLSVIFGFVLACAINLCLDYKKLSQKEELNLIAETGKANDKEE